MTVGRSRWQTPCCALLRRHFPRFKPKSYTTAATRAAGGGIPTRPCFSDIAPSEQQFDTGLPSLYPIAPNLLRLASGH
jgi:hypothetical protein